MKSQDNIQSVIGLERSKISSIIAPSSGDPLYNKFLGFIRNPQFIRFGPDEKIRTTELVEEFYLQSYERLSHTAKLPEFMGRFMRDNPTLGIVKKHRNYGTVYVGLGSIRLTPKTPEPPLLTFSGKTGEERWKENRDNLRLMSDAFKDRICQDLGLTEIQYRQLIHLKLVFICHRKQIIDYNATYSVIIGRAVEYGYAKLLPLEKAESHALSVQNDFNKTVQQDVKLSEITHAPVYTNRLRVAEMTYDAGDKLERAINTYFNTMNNIPTLSGVEYPDIPRLRNLARELKDNSMYRVRLNMKRTQEAHPDDQLDFDGWNLQDVDLLHMNLQDTDVEDTSEESTDVEDEDLKIFTEIIPLT